MRELGLDALVTLLLGVLLGLCECCGAVEDAKRLEPLLEDLAIVWRQLQWVACEVEHLDAFKRL